MLQETIDNDRDKLKAFLKAEIKGWNDAVADPAGAAKLAVENYGKDLKLNLGGQAEQAKAQNELVGQRRDQGERAVHHQRRRRGREPEVARVDRCHRRPPSSCSTSA